MHHALQIHEILSDILFYCSLPVLNTYHRKHITSTLASLARTCRTFKEPALDELWGTLDDLSPLVRCLPEASIHQPPNAYQVYQVR
ncbi:hypothetical protein OG21DRAFT_1421666 [Imleria badia]|nr:hypothetical protein OG21DRAFT_1421666 [Imleria badia]